MSPAAGRPARKNLSPAEIWARAEREAQRRKVEDILALQIEAMHRVHGLELPEREFRFDEKRLWRVDFAWPVARLAVEVEGITPEGGRHQRVAGFEKDAEKYNALSLAGWQLLRLTTTMVRSGYGITAIRVALERHHQVHGA